MTMKSCKNCSFLYTDSFISPCTHCIDLSHWEKERSFEEDMKKPKNKEKYTMKIIKGLCGWYIEITTLGFGTTYFGTFKTRTIARQAKKGLEAGIYKINTLVDNT